MQRLGEATTRIRLIWLGFAVAAVLSLDVIEPLVWPLVVIGAALVLLRLAPLRPQTGADIDRKDLLAIGVLYLIVVVLFRVAFVVFTTDNVLGLFLTFAAGLLVGVIGPVIYQVWMRGSSLRSLGIGSGRLGETLALGLTLATAQFAITLWGYEFPEPVDWVPLLVMSLVVGFFEAVLFRGFIQNRLEASFGTTTGVIGAATLYSLYHVGFGMGGEEMWLLLGLGFVYAIVFRLVGNVLVLWPLLTPIGSLFNNLQAGDIELPWASIAGFADVGVLMAVALWLARRHVRKRATKGGPDRVRPQVVASR